MMTTFWGLAPEQLSAITLLETFAPGGWGDERWHVRGGNDRIASRLARALPPGSVQLGSALTALGRAGEAFELRFSDRRRSVFARHVVLAAPFPALRRVDLSASGLPARRRGCIDRLGMGTNSKALLTLGDRPHAHAGWNGELSTDAPPTDVWESTVGQPGRGSVLTVFGGGRAADSYAATEAHGPASPGATERIAASLERGGVRGLTASVRGRAWLDVWALDPWAGGSYAAFLPGQYTRYYGTVGRRHGRIHFAGEHTATDSQGYLDGAVQSGERVAREILAAR
jgi:monoamine oxidase